MLAPASAAFDGNTLDRITAESESGNRRYGSDGGLIRSSAGALGEMQVMPSTARAPGFGLRPADPNNPDDLARLGREYRAKMQERYQNNAPKMWAAYNAGPGRVDNLVQQYGENWLDYAPRETRDYVGRNMRKLRNY